MPIPIMDEIKRLPVDERLELVDQIWESISDDELELTDAQKAELDRRLLSMEQNPDGGTPWEEVYERLRRR